MFANLSLTTIIISAAAIIFAITLHEAAHAWSAMKLGDDTAKKLGRVTLNPVPSIDPIGTLLLPGMMILSGVPFVFGWAKPVPVMFGRLGTARISTRYAIVLVAIAGPTVNILIALIAAVLSHTRFHSSFYIWIRPRCT